MTVLSFPSSMIPLRQRWQEERQDIELRSVFGSQILQPVPPVWATELEFDDRADWLAGDIKALWMQLAGGNQLEVYDTARPAPLGSYRGTLSLAADVAQGATSMQLVRTNDNLLTFPDAFDNAVWTKNAATVGANAVTAPDGTLTADKLVEDATSNPHQVRAFYTATAGVPVSRSVSAKAGERGGLTINFSGTGGASFNLLTGAVNAVGAFGGSWTDVTASIRAEGNGWFRCAISLTPTVTQSQTLRIGACDATFAGSQSSYLGDGLSGIYLWGAKLNLGASATDYGHNLTLLAGDLLGIGSGSKQQVVMVTQDAVSTGQGNITVNFEHPLRNGFSAGTAVTWDKPKALFRLRSNRPGWDYERSRAKNLKFDLVESVYP